MMGEFSGIDNSDFQEPEKVVDDIENGVPTDVEGVMANDVMKHGCEEFPVFDCDEKDFYQNMSQGRKRLRFKNGSSAARYMSGTKYSRPFYIRTKTSSGEVYTRKIK